MQRRQSLQATAQPAAIIELRTTEGGEDARSLVYEQLAIYVKLGARRGL